MANWTELSSLATGAGTLVLAVATFASVRSSNRAARVAEKSLMASMRPILIPSRENDPPERVMFGDRHWVTVTGHGAVFELIDDRLYFALPLRNVGTGLAVIHSWRVSKLELRDGRPTGLELPDLDGFIRNTRDLYVPNGDVGFWQGAIRGRDDDRFGDGVFDELRRAAENDDPIVVHLVYGDYESGRRTVTRFSIVREEESGELMSSVNRYWSLDDDDPRDRSG